MAAAAEVAVVVGSLRWSFLTSRAGGQSKGETRFVSDKEFTSTVNGTFDGQSSSMQSHARWVAADCGALQRP